MGVRLKNEEWDLLRKKFAEIDASPGSEDGIRVEIAKDLFVTVKPENIDIRRFYEDKDDGEMKPTKKGCCLQRADWTKLKGADAKLTEWLANPPSSSAEPAPKKQ